MSAAGRRGSPQNDHDGAGAAQEVSVTLTNRDTHVTYGRFVATRNDVSIVAPQGGYIAKQCPVRAQLNVLQPGVPVRLADDVLLRMRQGVEFEADVFLELQEHAPNSDWLFIRPDLSRDEAIAQTVAAMDAGAELIAGGWLPLDNEGRRTGKPDLLLRHDSGYVPVDVKHHITFDVSDAEPVRVSPLPDPSPGGSVFREGWSLRKRKDDALQLAHYRRMLQHSGYSATIPMAGIVGTERVVTWYDLDAPMWQTPAKSGGRKRKMRTAMEVYDFEFDFRLDIAAVAHQHQHDPSVDLLVLPVRRSECASCPWQDICNIELEAGYGDPSLISVVRFEQWRTLREDGITNRAGVAALNYPTAALAAAGVNVVSLLADAGATDAGTTIGELLSRSPKQRAAVETAGLRTAGEALEALDVRTASLDSGRWLAPAIIGARAVLGEAPVFRKPGVVTVPRRADIEIDVDMENTNAGVYLWGALVTDRTSVGVARDGYHSFSTWGPLDRESELAAFLEFWRWLGDIRAEAAGLGASVAGYCWHEQAENTQMRRIAAADPRLAREVEGFIASDQWVDLMKVFDRSWTTGGSIGLKAIAPLSGFGWPVDNPGGAMAMVHHAQMQDSVTSAEEASQLQRWLLDYNRGDVEATFAIREWLHNNGAEFPAVSTR
jgi:predicted RecB family nuclease